MFKQSSIMLTLSLLLYSSTALANVDTTGKSKIEVSSWTDLKSAVENSNNVGKVIVLKGDIIVDPNNPIKSIGGSGIIIDGAGFSIKGSDNDSQFLSFTSKKSDLIIQNVTFDGLTGIPDGYGQKSGGVIYNNIKSTLGDINANFSNNNLSLEKYPDGGAIYNEGTIGNITGDFNNNNASSGGAIYNEGTIGNITGDFTNNSGGAIYNYSIASIGDVVGNFINNSDGAIYNSYASSIGNIKGVFQDNSVFNQNFLASGGAILNSSTSFDTSEIKNIEGKFIGNNAQSESGEAQGGAISNYGSDSSSFFAGIGDINADFEENYALSKTGSAQGGAFYNSGNAQIGNISGTFTGNYAQSESNYAQGGAIYTNSTSLTFVNTSFYDNFIQTNAVKDSLEGQLTQGGAIYSTNALTIKADGGQSIFSGNKVIRNGEEESSAIYLVGDKDLNFNSVNGGYIKFDDKITNQNKLEQILLEEKSFGATVTEDGNGGYVITGPDSIVRNISKVDNGYWYTKSYNTGYTYIEYLIDNYKREGYDVQQEGDNYIITGKNAFGVDQYITLTKDENGVYTEVIQDFISANNADIIITGDSSSKVEFNEQIENFNTIDVSGTNVDVNGGIFYRSITHDGGVTNINSGATAEDSLVNQGGTMNVSLDGKAYRTEVNDGGLLHVASGGYAQDTTLNTGASLNAEEKSELHNMLVNDGANLDIDAGAYLSGNIIIHAGAVMGGTYDYSKIFKDDVLGDGSLTLVGGLNEALNESSLINTTEGKRLNLTSGDYVVGDNAYAVNGWDMLTLKDTANVKLEGDITLTGPNKKLIIENGSNLNLAGNSPSNYTITGSVSNAGMMDFTHPDDEADDITTIYGNYTAYNKAQMTIDVNPITNTSDLLRIDGDVAGTTDVVLNVLDYNTKPTELIKFVEATNDDLSTGAYFNIFRVDGSAFKWNSLYKDGAWYTGTNDLIADGSESGYGDGDKGNLEDDENLEDDAVLPPNFPDVPGGDGNNGKGPSVVGEAIAYMGLPSAGIEQTRDMTRNITNKVASTKVYSQQCHGFYDCEYDGKALRNAWAAPVYSYSDVKAPYSYEAEISGFEGGFDIQSDVYNRLGVFASYRQGSYDFDGDGDEYYSKTGADMDIDSYILGLYHRYDEGKLWTMGQIFLGYQDVSMSSDDGVSSSTDGIEFGAAVEGGLIFNPMTNLTIEPIIRLAYTQINYDDATDNYGKTAKYGDVRNIEVEAGVKVEKTYLRKNGYAKVYVKPSIIQNIGSGDVQVTSLRKVDGLENSTLGRIEVGGSMSFDEQWSGYANAAYTFGSDYTNLGLNAGLNYAF